MRRASCVPCPSHTLSPRLGLVLTVGLLCLLPACGGSVATPVPVSDVASSNLTAVRDCQTLDRFLTDAAVDLFVWQWVNGGGMASDPMPGGVPVPGNAGGEGADAGAPDGPSDFTTTNVQERGVDEPDLVKTDGQHIYYLQQGVLHVLQAWPPEEADAVGRVELEGHDGALFLAGNTVVALTSIFEVSHSTDPCGPSPGTGGEPTGEPRDEGLPPDVEPPPCEPPEVFQAVRVSLVDVSTPSAPTVAHSFDIEGHLVGARMVGGIVYLASQHTTGLYDADLNEELAALGLPDPWMLSPDQRRAMADDVAARVRPTFARYVTDRGRDALIPDLRTDGKRSELLSCDEILRPEQLCDLAMLSVVGFRPETGVRPQGVGLIANGWQVYASPDALYVSQDSRWWCWRNDTDRRAETHIHQFGLNAGSPVYLASGAVPGWTLNQFSMSEHEDHLRVATTDFTSGGWRFPPMGGDGGMPMPGGDGSLPPTGGGGVPGGPEGPPTFKTEPPPRDANNVFVLRRKERELTIVGGIRGIAPDEQIRACRFLGDVGYVVTFEQVDPLFAIDLSDPENPEVRGELHITGFSSYLHPMDRDQYLIGVGREATPEGRVQGLQLQLFDVRVLERPTRIHQELLGTPGTWSFSEAEHDHHAFTFDEQQGLLALPVTLEDWGRERADYQRFSGAVVFSVDTEMGFEEVGRVSHTGFVKERHCTPEKRGEDPAVEFACDEWSFPWMARMRRTLFLDEYLYAFSEFGVTVSHLKALDEPVAEIPLR